MRDQVKRLLGLIGVDRFTATALAAMDDLGRQEFDNCTRLSSVLWQHGLLGFVEAGECNFFTSPESSDFDLPDDAEEYVFHPCVLDSVRGVRSVGARPVHPYKQS